MEATYKHPLLGTVTYRFEGTQDHYKRGAEITFVSGFELNAVTRVAVPQLKGVKKSSGGTSDGTFKFHKDGHAQLVMVFAELERMSLLAPIKEFGGALYPRLRKPFDKHGKEVYSTLPSNHSFGIAIDINPDAPNHGDTTAPIAHVFMALGFHWGVTFNDPMHFEIERFIAHPQQPSADELARCKMLAAQQLQDFVDRRSERRRRSEGPSAAVGVAALEAGAEVDGPDLSLEDEHDHGQEP